jgi:DICT domain-containing protein/GAF domain-containing protein
MAQSSSLLQDLQRLLPQLKAQIYFKTSLTAISHAMEDLVLAGGDRPLVIANFQQERFYRQEMQRYHKIAQVTDQVYVLATPETDFVTTPVPYSTIGLDPADALAQEWHLVIVGPQYSACLVCREHATPEEPPLLDSARQFQGFWSFDPLISRQAAGLLLQRIKTYRPDLSSHIKQAKQRYQLSRLPETGASQSSFSELDAQLFTERLITYLQSSQYKLLKAYRRSVEQERQERLVNQITAAIRQSLKPADVLSATVREVAQLFSHCRCFAYGLASTLPAATSTVDQLEYERAPTDFAPLLGKNWRLAAQPPFRDLLDQGQLVAIADIQQDSGLQAQTQLRKQLEQAQVQACLLVPIYAQQQCLAVLELHHPEPYLWTPPERDLLRAIATQVGLALLQAEAFVSLQQFNQQLMAMKQTQNNLIAIVGHELRTPLSTIQVCLESLDSEPDMPLEFQQAMVETALADSERLRKLIQDFLLLSRLESNLMTWHIQPVNLAESIHLAVRSVQATAQGRDLPTITVDLPADLPLLIADDEALFQLLSKLLDNACKFTPATGTVTLRVREVTVSATPDQPLPQPQLELEIADTGCGIEANHLETIFERFHQEEGFLQRGVGGAGLGLAICRQVVRQLGGRIWATSAGKGLGSQFYVTLPVLSNTP